MSSQIISNVVLLALSPVTRTVSQVSTVIAELGRWLAAAVTSHPVAVAAAVAGAATVRVALRIVIRRVRHRRLRVGARLVTVLAPPRVDPDGAAALWGNLAGLLRPRWRRLLFGQPHLCFEYVITAAGSTIRLWVPGPVPPGLIEHAVAAAWPGATTSTALAPSGHGAVAWWRPVTAGWVLRLARPGGLPIDDHAPGDPVGALLAAPGSLHTPLYNTPNPQIPGRDTPDPDIPGHDTRDHDTRDHDTRDHDAAARGTASAGQRRLPPADRVVVQVLARPVGAQRVGSAGAGHGGASVPGGLIGDAGAIAVWGVRELLTLITPGPLSATDPVGRGPRTAATGPGVDRRTRLENSSTDRAAVAKARGAAFETLIRCAATTYVPDPADGRGAFNDDPGVVGPQARAAQLTAAQITAAQQNKARRRVRGRAHSVAAVFASFTGHNFYRRRHLRHPEHAIAERRLGRGDLLSVAELAAIAALPTADHVPGLVRAGARSVAAPPGIAAPGPDVKPLGDTTTADQATPDPSTPDPSTPDQVWPNRTPPGATAPGGVTAGGATNGGAWRGRAVGVRVADARHHLHVVGVTGSGKSTMLVHQILADIRAGRGVVVIDPKGDLVTDVTDRLPARVLARAVIIDPDRSALPPCLNPLATLDATLDADTPTANGTAHPAQSCTGSAGAGTGDLAVEHLVSIFARLFAAFWGPRTDDLMRAACLTLRAQPTPRSLADLPALLTDPSMRARHVHAVHDPLLRGFWTWYEHLSDSAQAQITAPLMNKIRTLLLRPFTRAVLTGQYPTRGSAGGSTPSATPTSAPMLTSAPTSAPAGATRLVHMRSVLDGGILLARLPKGSLGDDGTRLVGSIVVAQVWAAATARAAVPQHLRRDAALVIDECHNFLNLPYGIPEILAEARGLRLSLTLAHQHLAQLPREMREGISSNARNKLIFTVGPDDARDLARHTLPQLGEHDLAHLDAFHAAARLVNHGADTPAFTLRTRPLPPPPQRRSPRPARNP